jgi:hypothetical protein
METMMSGKLRIEWLEETSDCDQAGCSGGWSTGAKVFRDGEAWFELTPEAGCFGGVSWTEGEVYTEIINRLGFELIPDYS